MNSDLMEMLMAMTADLENVTVDAFEGLLMTYCVQKNANAVLRGIRAVSDYEFRSDGDVDGDDRRLGKRHGRCVRGLADDVLRAEERQRSAARDSRGQ